MWKGFGKGKYERRMVEIEKKLSFLEDEVDKLRGVAKEEYEATERRVDELEGIIKQLDKLQGK